MRLIDTIIIAYVLEKARKKNHIFHFTALGPETL
jgi:hypothetical protein